MVKEVQQSAPLAPPPAASNVKESLGKRMIKTKMNHVYNIDVTGDGRYREAVVVKLVRNENKEIQSIYYIDTVLLDNVDKGRLKFIISSVHADKYELWDLLSQNTINNGKNALDYFHQLVRVIHGPGAVTTQFSGGLAGAALEPSEMVGKEFSDPLSASIDTQAVN